MKYAEAKEKLKEMGGNCISISEGIGDTKWFSVSMHKDGKCVTGNSFEECLARFDFKATAPDVSDISNGEAE